MLPVEVLISEHRLIERIVKFIGKEMEKMAETQKVETNFLVTAVDFFRTYADRYHHGKEEGILFNALSQKKLSEVDEKIMFELMMEHSTARRTVNRLETLKEAYLSNKVDALKDILQTLKVLVELYPAHIEKEDKHFFLPSMTYFTKQEQEEMLNKFMDFNRDFTDKRYQQIITMLES